MLVLSRGLRDKIVFPNLSIEVEILRVTGNRVRVGVEAPKDVRVLRHELADSLGGEPSEAQSDSHEFRNRLNTAHVALSLAEKQMNAGLNARALETLRRAMSELDSLDATLSPAVNPPKPTEEIASNPRALLVEDDPNECELLAGYLRISGFNVNTAEDGLQAMIHLGSRRPPEFVLVDMQMPRMNGAETVQSIRSDPTLDGIKVFAITGAPACESAVEIGPRGVDNWFQKPIDPQRLVNLMRESIVRS